MKCLRGLQRRNVARWSGKPKRGMGGRAGEGEVILAQISSQLQQLVRFRCFPAQ